MAHVLSGIKVIEIGTFITGPCAAMQLAELGADVVKVEQPSTGDPFRSYNGGSYSPQFQAYNAGKRSITINLKSSLAVDALLKLIGTADVLIENYRPGVMDSLGLGWERLHALNSELVYCSITGFGADGPYADRPCYDTVAQAMSGYLSQFVDPESPTINGPAVADAITGIYAANGILGALVERGRTKKGRRVEVAMIDAMIAFTAEPFANYLASGMAPRPQSRPAVSQAYALACADRKLVALHLASLEKFWRALLSAIEVPELATDAKFATREARTENYALLRTTLQEIFMKRPRAEWLERLVAHDVPHSEIALLEEVMRDPHVVQTQLFARRQHATQGTVVVIRRPIMYDGSRDGGSLPPPVLGEHSNEVLAELGYGAQAIATMTAAAKDGG